MKYSGMVLIGFLIIIIAIAGCIEPDKPLATQTTVPTSSCPCYQHRLLLQSRYLRQLLQNLLLE